MTKKTIRDIDVAGKRVLGARRLQRAVWRGAGWPTIRASERPSPPSSTCASRVVA